MVVDCALAIHIRAAGPGLLAALLPANGVRQMNWKVKNNMPREISRRLADFLQAQAGAETAAVKTFSLESELWQRDATFVMN